MYLIINKFKLKKDNEQKKIHELNTFTLFFFEKKIEGHKQRERLASFILIDIKNETNPLKVAGECEHN